MTTVTLTIDPAFRVGPVRRRTFGAFVEHLGRCVYTGIHDPEHPTADADGFRGDVIDLTRATSGPAGSTWPGTPPSPTWSASTSSCAGRRPPAPRR